MYSDATATQVVFIIDAPARSMDWSAFLCVVNAKVVLIQGLRMTMIWTTDMNASKPTNDFLSEFLSTLKDYYTH